ncbi:MAG: DUF2130 domain-containing protein [Phycisphaerae bacterium]|nr:DUF2130 domain-containing protein [Phycisphaerae bacterium]
MARQKLINAGQGSIKDIIYEYVTGQEFGMHIKRIVTAFAQMKEQLEKEKLATIKLWSKREKQIAMVLENVVEIRGSMERLVGEQKALPAIDVLSLEAIATDDDENEN